jgi:two-component system sensor histidine kinase KdpD
LNVRVSTIGVAELVQRGIDGLPDPDRSRVEPRVVDGVTTIGSDPALLERVLANLLANALVADPSGIIAVVAQPDGTGGHGVRLDVIDHGPGLPPDVRALAFKPFQRLEDRGSTSGIGLGLSICSGL